MTVPNTITLTMACDDMQISLTEKVPGIVQYSSGALSIDSGLRPAIDRMARKMAQLVWEAMQQGQCGGMVMHEAEIKDHSIG